MSDQLDLFADAPAPAVVEASLVSVPPKLAPAAPPAVVAHVCGECGHIHPTLAIHRKSEFFCFMSLLDVTPVTPWCGPEFFVLRDLGGPCECCTIACDYYASCVNANPKGGAHA